MNMYSILPAFIASAALTASGCSTRTAFVVPDGAQLTV